MPFPAMVLLPGLGRNWYVFTIAGARYAAQAGVFAGAWIRPWIDTVAGVSSFP